MEGLFTNKSKGSNFMVAAGWFGGGCHAEIQQQCLVVGMCLTPVQIYH